MPPHERGIDKETKLRPAASSARVFTVPPGQAFLPALASAVLAGDLPRPGGPRLDPLFDGGRIQLAAALQIAARRLLQQPECSGQLLQLHAEVAGA